MRAARLAVTRQVLALAITAAAGCSTIVEEMPQAPTNTPPSGAPVPVPVVIVPVPVPTPPPATPPPPPVPVPQPGPTPAPPPPGGGSCNLPPGNGSGVNCPKRSPSFLAEVDTAINQLVQARPDLFNLNDQRGAGGYRILNIDQFLHGVAANLRAMGLCAIVDAGGELAVKNSNAFSDQYDLVLSSGHIFRGAGSYAATCSPAWF